MQGSDSKIRIMADTGTLFRSSNNFRGEMTQTETASLKTKVASLAIEPEKQKYQLQASKDELTCKKQIAEKCGQ